MQWERGSGGEGHSLELIALLAILALAGVLRLGWPGIVEFKRDEANLSALALDLTHGRNFPLLGIDSSVGIRNSPMSVYIMALPYLFTTDPEFATSFVGALNVIGVLLLYLFVRRYYGVPAALLAALLFAANPWAVIFARKIWAQDLLPTFVIATVATGVIGLTEGKRWAQWLHFPLLAITGQIHYGAFVLIPITLWLIVVGIRRRTVRWALAGGLINAALLTVPYAIGMAQAGLLNPARIQQVLNANPDRPQALTLTGDAIHDAALMIAGIGTESRSLAGPQVYQHFLASVPDAYPIFNWLAWAVLIAALWLIMRAVRYRDSRMPIDVAALLWLIITPLAYSVTWTTLYTHYFIPMLPGAFVVLGIAGGDLWRALEKQLTAQRIMTIVGGAAAIGMAGLQAWLFIALLLFVDARVTPGGFGTPLHYLLTIRQAVLDQHPQYVLANLDGQYIGYHDETTVWNTLLYAVPSVRFLDGNTEVYPTQPALYLSHRCSGATSDFYLRPPGEGCYAIGERTPGNFDAASFAPIPPDPSVRFANGIRLLGYNWRPQPFHGTQACLALAWTVDANPAPNDYHFAIHFTDRTGREIVFADGLSWRGVYWHPGDIIAQRFCPPDQTHVTAIVGVNLGMYTQNGATFHNVDLLGANGGAVGQTVSVKFPTIVTF
ncbi:MAG: glycosyltransferase family 39 protein [Aggregatilineales bacterium]